MAKNYTAQDNGHTAKAPQMQRRLRRMMLTKLKYECKTKSDYELVRKAREAVK